MTFGLLIVILVALFVAMLLAGAWVVISSLAAPPEDTQGREANERGSTRSGSIFGRLRRWLNRKPARLDYRRDKRGRFRKVRRG